jgi:hypothetical protein
LCRQRVIEDFAEASCEGRQERRIWRTVVPEHAAPQARSRGISLSLVGSGQHDLGDDLAARSHSDPLAAPHVVDEDGQVSS